VKSKPLVWLIAAAILICAFAGGGFLWLRARALRPEALLKRLPTRGALVAYIDFEALRKAGVMRLLDGAKTPEDAEYTAFVRQTGFDYKRDLDAAMVSFAPGGKFLLLRGRFEWSKLKEYAASTEGECDPSVCHMTGSTPERRISFFLLRPNLLALAVSPDDGAVLRLRETDGSPDAGVPAAPLWLRFAPSALSSNAALPEGARLFAGAMDRADSVTLAFAPEAARIAANLEIRCRQPGDAAEIASQLTKITAALREGLAPGGRSNPDGFGAVLAAGAFRAEGARVVGNWPIEKALLEKALGAQ
jgi:hypothetical protein